MIAPGYAFLAAKSTARDSTAASSNRDPMDHHTFYIIELKKKLKVTSPFFCSSSLTKRSLKGSYSLLKRRGYIIHPFLASQDLDF